MPKAPKLKDRIKQAQKKKNQYVLSKENDSLKKPKGYRKRIKKSDKLKISLYTSSLFKKHRMIRRALVAGNKGLGGRNLHVVRLKVRVNKGDPYKYISVIAASNVATHEHSEDRTAGLIDYLQTENDYHSCEIVSDRTERERCAKCRNKHPPTIAYDAAYEYPTATDYSAKGDRNGMARFDRQENNKKMAKDLRDMQMEDSDDELDNESDSDDLVICGDTIDKDIAEDYILNHYKKGNISFLFDA